MEEGAVGAGLCSFGGGVSDDAVDRRADEVVFGGAECECRRSGEKRGDRSPRAQAKVGGSSLDF